MKKTLFFTFLILLFVFTISGCDKNAQQTQESHVHVFGEWITVQEATCTTGCEQVRYCSCGDGEARSTEALGHLAVIDAAVPATCMTEGETEGVHCSRCNEILVEQTLLGKGDHTFGNWSITKYATKDEEGERMHVCSVCNTAEYDVIDRLRYDGARGSAGKISDTTVIVSIFANDSGTSWDFDSDRDKQTIQLMHTHLSSAVQWLEKNCAEYGANAKFYYDWNTCSDLLYTFDFADRTLVREDGGEYTTQSNYIRDCINSEELKQRYNAQNILYIFYFNTDEQNTINSWTLSDRKNCDIEIINAFVRNDYPGGWYYTSASGFAHEILHCFGAYDLYYASDAIPQAYVDYCKQTNSQDIMYTSNIGKDIKPIFTALCAYYVGLTDDCADVEQWNLAKSTHIVT